MFEQLPLFAPSTSSSAGSHVRTSAGPARAKGCPARAQVSGGPTATSCARCDPMAFSSRTSSRACLVGTAPFVARSKPWAIERGPVRSALPMLAPRIGEHDSSCWPTPTVSGEWNRRGASATSGDGLRTAVLYPTPSTTSYGSNRGGAAGRTGAARPSLETLAKGWATPQARDEKGPSTRARRHSGACLPGQAGGSGKLNPAWVETLMGFPPGWTDVFGWKAPKVRGTWDSPIAGQPVEAKSSAHGSRRARSRAKSRSADPG